MPQNSTTHEAPFTGGCQCGAVRFAVGRLGRGSICHCRMCQKAFGSFFGPLVTSFDVTWTRGEPKYFESSDKIRRGFCANCGTPLTYEEIGRPPEQQVEIAIGAFDDPTVAAPVIQVNMADKLPFFDGLAALPVRTEYSPGWHEFMASLVSHQHPDHDTQTWPPKDGFPA
jgi:hypothetical protein